MNSWKIQTPTQYEGGDTACYDFEKDETLKELKTKALFEQPMKSLLANEFKVTFPYNCMIFNSMLML